ncbi:hypothetical protein NM688_g7906 [Phlebia brevispora]|uniref:Uncharacterized protein n=1 Tax=Phlebia brevispora TaxID=194682 RepID=A0ACC1RZQ3_9APHY|nr:hypothetical protein NM688_g7906 [Phlebia brevispora]
MAYVSLAIIVARCSTSTATTTTTSTTTVTTMSEEGYPSSGWERSDSDHPNMPPATQYQSRDSLDAHTGVPPTPTRTTSPPRLSVDSPHRASNMRRRDSAAPAATPISVHPPEDDGVLETSFEENVLRALCDLDCGVPLLLDRIKQSMVSCKEVATFFKKRAVLEEEYARNLQKLARNTMKEYQSSDGKAGSFVSAWSSLMKMHEVIGDHRLQWARGLNEMSVELNKIASDCDQERKSTKDLATRYERALQEAESATEKSKARVEVTAEELERVLLQKEGESLKDNAVQGRSPGGVSGKRVIGKAVAKGGMLLKGKNPESVPKIQRQEDDIRARMSAASDTYRKNVTDTQAIRQEYFNFQLPRILRVNILYPLYSFVCFSRSGPLNSQALHSVSGNLDLGTQYHLNRFGMQFEATVLNEGTTLTPIDEGKAGLKNIIESIDNRADFKAYMHSYAFAHGGINRGPRRNGPPEDGFVRLVLFPVLHCIS